MTGSGRLLARLTRYATVSAISTSVTLSLLGALVYTRAMSAGWANVVATAVGTVPSFELNRRWVWAKSGRRSVMKEVAPFCTLSLFELVISTGAVSVAARWSSASGLGHSAVTLISQGANLSTFGALWAFQYVLLDRALFGRHSHRQGGAATNVNELAQPGLMELEDAA
jgi:putative flippase GtrA